MAVYFVRPTNGSDSNDGLDFHGFDLSGATYDDTGNGEGEHHLSSTGAFSSYTWNSGDTIYLSGGAGITAGLYEVASKVDADAILLTASAGSDSTSDVTSSDGAFLTFQAALDAVAAGDRIHLCKEGSAPHETVAVQIDVDGAIGTTSSAIQIYAASGTTGALDLDNGQYHLQWTSSVGTGVNAPANEAQYYHWHDVLFDYDDNVTSRSFKGGNSSSFTSNRFVRVTWLNGRMCEFEGHATTMIGCRVKGAADDGLKLENTDNLVLGCLFEDCGGDGLWADSSRSTFLYNTFVRCGDNGFLLAHANNTVMHNVFYGSTNAGLRVSSSTIGAFQPLVVMNNSFAKNGTYGLQFTAPVASLANVMVDHNHYWNNTSGAAYDGAAVTEANVNAGTELGTHNVTGDPSYTSEVSGSEDFMPDSETSILFRAGFSHMGIDEVQTRIAHIGVGGPPHTGGGGGGGGGVGNIIGGGIIRALGSV